MKHLMKAEFFGQKILPKSLYMYTQKAPDYPPAGRSTSSKMSSSIVCPPPKITSFQLILVQVGEDMNKLQVRF